MSSWEALTQQDWRSSKQRRRQQERRPHRPLPRGDTARRRPSLSQGERGLLRKSWPRTPGLQTVDGETRCRSCPGCGVLRGGLERTNTFSSPSTKRMDSSIPHQRARVQSFPLRPLPQGQAALKPGRPGLPASAWPRRGAPAGSPHPTSRSQAACFGLPSVRLPSQKGSRGGPCWRPPEPRGPEMLRHRAAHPSSHLSSWGAPERGPRSDGAARIPEPPRTRGLSRSIFRKEHHPRASFWRPGAP